MLFNSFDFAIFVALVFALYFLLKTKHRWQNILLLLASLIFYGFWNWKFLALILFSTTVDFFAASQIYKNEDPKIRKRWLLVSLGSNLTLLGFFKYFNFFVSNFADFLTTLGLSPNVHALQIILPVGISFYTFEALSYTIDIYRRELEPTRNFADFALFVSFFPHLVAGPIMRARDLLPQIAKPRKISKAKIYEGSFLFLWGLYKKVFIADNLAKIADAVFSSGKIFGGWEYIVAIYAFAFQIYADFSGYSDMARGIGKWFGFDLMLNFNLPYFAKNPSDFWKRWHISLSNWLKNYLYIPLGGNRKSEAKTYRNLFLTMLLGGLWHGAGWTFVVWGIYQGLILIFHRLWVKFIGALSFFAVLPGKLVSAGKIFLMLQATMLGWLFFRAESFTQIKQALAAISGNLSYSPEVMKPVLILVFYSAFLIAVQIFQHNSGNLMVLRSSSAWVRVPFYLFIICSIFILGALGGRQFIYFQF